MIPRTTPSPMAMGKRKRHAKQASMWVATVVIGVRSTKILLLEHLELVI
jgi:hypothetical protein